MREKGKSLSIFLNKMYTLEHIYITEFLFIIRTIISKYAVLKNCSFKQNQCIIAI